MLLNPPIVQRDSNFYEHLFPQYTYIYYKYNILITFRIISDGHNCDLLKYLTTRASFSLQFIHNLSTPSV